MVLVARSCYSFAMSWIFDEHAAPGANPWSWERGSPASFPGRRSCGCLRCQVCSCHQPRPSSPPAASAHDDDKRSTPPTASTHDDDNRAGILCPTFRTGAKYPKSRIEHSRAVDDILGRYYRRHGTYAGALVYIKPNVCSCADPPLLALRTCEDRCEYCNYRPCVEAYDHGEMTNYAMPHRCTLRQKGLDCEALEDHRASAGVS